MINNTKNGSTKEEVTRHLQNKGERNIVGGAGAFGFLGGANVISVGKQILKSGLGKGAINFVKNFFNKKIIPGGGGTYGKSNLGNLKGTGPSRGGNVNEIIGPLGKGLNKSKPVNFTGPNPAHKIGAGGNSYPR